MINWGILGAGSIAHKFAADFKAVKSAKVMAVGSRDKKRSAEFAGKHHIAKAYSSYKSLVSDPEIDVIYIATPHSFHYEQSKLCLENGKHVLCEKPVTVNAHQLKVLMALAKQKKRFFMEAMWTPFLPAIKKVQQWLDADEIGAIKAMQVNFGFLSGINAKERLFNPQLAGGSLLDIGIYPLTLFEMFANSEIRDLQCIANLSSTGVDESLAVQIKYANGILAQMQSTFIANLQNDAVIYGEKGKIVIPKFWMSKKAYLHANDQVTAFADDADTWGYNFEAESVSRDILAGKLQNRIMPLTRSLKMLELMDRIRKIIGLQYPFE